MTELQTKLLDVLNIVRVECYLRSDTTAACGRPLQEGSCGAARVFLAKAVYNIGTPRTLIDRICSDPRLRRLYGWERQHQIPSEATFSRAFAEFAVTCQPDQMHRALIESCYEEEVVGHASRDSTAIQARKRPAAKEPAPAKRKPGRARKGEQSPRKQRRVVRQLGMSLQEMEDDLPKECNRGFRRNAKNTSKVGTAICCTLMWQTGAYRSVASCGLLQRPVVESSSHTATWMPWPEH